MENKMKKRLKKRNFGCVGLIGCGILSVYVGNCMTLPVDLDFSTGFYTGLGFALIASAIITIIKNLRIIHSEEKLKEKTLAEYDERNQAIRMKTWCYAGYAMFFLLYIALIIAGMFNETVMMTLLAVFACYWLCVFICAVVLEKVM
ncbi:MAG: hypothetical protein E7292_07020 [Lachnospiraceae bacterium]|nr:hypothetical protein [Lachnospiraceae bacterium]